MKVPENQYAIDFYGLSGDEARDSFPEGYQIVLDRVKPKRDENRREIRKRNWWLFGENAPKLRRACKTLEAFIATSEVAKHRVFSRFSLPDHLADGSLAAIATDDSFILGILSSRWHVVWSLATGGRLEDRPRYQNGPCFLPFPFADASDSQKSRIRELGEQLDAHRKRQQELHPKLTMTGMYNVLEKLRSGEPLSAKEQEIHEQGLVSVLREIHDELDAAVAVAYGWPVDLPDEEILARLVALNHERAEEERRGIVRWLRPEFQNPSGVKQTAIEVEEEGDDQGDVEESTGRASGTRGGKKSTGRASGTRGRKKSTGGASGTRKVQAGAKGKKLAWPKGLAEQAAAVQGALVAIGTAATVEEVANRFLGSKKNQERVEELLDTLASLGKARELEDGRFVAV